MATITPLSVRISAALDDQLFTSYQALQGLDTGITFQGLSDHLTSQAVDAEKLKGPSMDPVIASRPEREPPLTVEVTIELEDQ